jgi:hypothetical protein
MSYARVMIIPLKRCTERGFKEDEEKEYLSFFYAFKSLPPHTHLLKKTKKRENQFIMLCITKKIDSNNNTHFTFFTIETGRSISRIAPITFVSRGK